MRTEKGSAHNLTSTERENKIMKMEHKPIKAKNIHYWQDMTVYALYYISNNTIYYNLDFAGKCKKIIYQRGF